MRANQRHTRYIVAVIEVDARDYRGCVIEDSDLTEAVEARLDEFYPITGDHLSPDSVKVAAVQEDSLRVFLQAADVGLEGLTSDSEEQPLPGVDSLDVIHADQLLAALKGDG